MAFRLFRKKSMLQTSIYYVVYTYYTYMYIGSHNIYCMIDVYIYR